MTPVFKLLANGIDITGRINDRLLKAQLTDHDGNKSDELTITLDDRDFAVELPKKGAMLEPYYGYVETGIASMGLFKVNRRQRGFKKQSGTTIEITAKSADLKDKMKSQRHAGYVGKTLGVMVKEVAGRHGYSAIVSPKLASLLRSPEYQTEESDLHFLTRLAHDHDAVFKVAGGKFLFLGRDEIANSEITLTAGDFDELTVEDDDRASHAKARAHSYNRGEVRRDEDEADGEMEGGDFTLRHTFQNRAIAKACAHAKKRQLERASKTLNGKGPGNIHVMAGLILVTIVGAELYDGRWRIKTATHTFTKGEGYVTGIQAGTDERGGGGE